MASEFEDRQEPGGDPSAGTSRRPSERRRSLTPEERRLLSARTYQRRPAVSGEDCSPHIGRERPSESSEPLPTTISEEADPLEKPPAAAEPSGRSRGQMGSGSADVSAFSGAANAIKLRKAILIIAGLVFLAMVFFAGRKFDRIKYLISSQTRAAELDALPPKFRAISVEELIQTGLAAEKRGDWRDAVERLIAAKRKNLGLPGALFHVGKGSFERGDMDGADAAFSHAIRFGENVAAANHYRGLIAIGRHDVSAAARFFEAAANAEPFISDSYYFLAEALRLDQHPREAIRRYEEVIERSMRPEDATLCAFKIRLARIEAAEAAAVANDIARAREAGPLSVDWIMTDAALQIHKGNTADAVRLIGEARAQGASALFLTCVGDTVFRKAAETHSDIAQALNTVAAPAPSQ